MKNKIFFVTFFLIFLTIFGCSIDTELATFSAPKNFKLLEISSNSVVLCWDVEYGAAGYIIYVSTVDSLSSAFGVKVGLTDGVIISGLESCTTYYFWVKAINFVGEGEASNMVEAKTIVGSPDSVNISFDENDLILSWDSVPNASKYVVYYGKTSSMENAEKTIVNAVSSNTVTKTIEDYAIIDGLYYAWVFGVSDNISSSYAATKVKRKGIPNYKFYERKASSGDTSIGEISDNTEVFMIKINSSTTPVIKDKTGGITSVNNKVTTEVDVKKYPEFSIVGKKLTRDSEVFVSVKDDSVPIRKEHELSKNFDFSKLKNVATNKLSSRSFNSEIQSRASYKSYVIGDSQSFWVDDALGQFSNKRATLRAEGTYGYVWVLDELYSDSSSRDDDNKITTSQAQQVAKKFDELYSAETTIFGQTYKDYYNQFDSSKAEKFLDSGYVLPEEKISILICDIYEDYSPIQNSGIVGYFWAKDFIDDNIINSKNGWRSNETEIFYIDSHFLDSYTEMTYSTLAHEFQHMLNFVNKNLKWNVVPSTWYNEMLSMVCEDLLQDYIGIEDKDSPRSRLAQFNYGYLLNGINEWLNNDDVYYSYAHAYAFGAFITRNYGGAELVKAMMENESKDLDSILDAINTVNSCSLEVEDLLKEFARALCYPEGFEGSEDDENSLLGKAAKANDGKGLKHFYRGNSCTIEGFEYKLRPIRLADYPVGYYDSNNVVRYSYGPYYLGVSNIYDLRPLGISVHSFGIKSGDFTFTYKVPSLYTVDVYFVIQ